ncbi:hypothetical protein LPJ76_000391 [Coemansia sp. RSA 638]|nr:hypothetical protein LPJ76_000391 [Coemansia sp. RSA 638]
MSIFRRFWQSPSRKDCVINFAVLGVFALIIIGVVLGTVLPKRHNALQLESDSLDLVSTLVEYSDVFSTTSDWSSETDEPSFTDYFEDAEDDSSVSIPSITSTAPTASTKTVASVTSTSKMETKSEVSSEESSSDLSSSESHESVSTENSPDYTTERALWGLTYSPYNTDGSCPDLATVASQLQKVAGVTGNIRLYSTDCSQLRNALQAISSSNLNLGIHAGLWISDGAPRMQSDLDEFIAAAKQYDSSLVKGVSVGNEDLSKGMSEATLIGYINKVRARLQTEGLGHIPVYTTEQDALFSQSLATVCDLVQINVHTIFDSAFTSIDASVQSVIHRVNTVKANVARGKLVRVGETGWASAGNTGPSPLTLANEISYVQKFRCAARKSELEYFYFEAKDALWKQGQALSEQNFGIFSAQYTPKFNFLDLSSC